MLNWPQMEERIDEVKELLSQAETKAMEQAEIDAIADDEAGGVRRWVATAFVQLGARIDRQAVADYAADEAVA